MVLLDTTLSRRAIIQKYHCVKSVLIRSFFWFVFSRIWIEYEDLLHKSPYSVHIWENKDPKKLCIRTFFAQ